MLILQPSKIILSPLPSGNSLNHLWQRSSINRADIYKRTSHTPLFNPLCRTIYLHLQKRLRVKQELKRLCESLQAKKIHLNLYCKLVKLKSKFSQEFIMYVLFANVMLLDTLQPGYINPVNFEASHKDSPDHNII